MPQIPAERLKTVSPWILLLSLMFFINYTDRSILAPLLVNLEQDLNINHAQATGIMLYLAWGHSISIAFSSFVVARLRPKIIICISVCGSGVCLLALSYLHTLQSISLCMGVMGLFTGLYMTSAMATIGSLIKPQLWSRAVSLHELAPNLSFVLGPIIAEVGLRLGGDWRGSTAIMAWTSIAAGIIYYFFSKGGETKAAVPSWGGVKRACTSPLVLFFTWCFAAGIIGEFGTYNVLTLHLTFERGYDATTANNILALTRLLSPFIVLLGGMVTPHLGTRRTIQIFFLLHGASLIMMGLPQTTVALVGMFIQPMMPAFAFPGIFTIITRNFPAQDQPMLLGLTLPVASWVGIGLAPKLFGLSGTYWTFSGGFIVCGVIFLLSLPFCRMLRKD